MHVPRESDRIRHHDMREAGSRPGLYYNFNVYRIVEVRRPPSKLWHDDRSMDEMPRSHAAWQGKGPCRVPKIDDTNKCPEQHESLPPSCRRTSSSSSTKVMRIAFVVAGQSRGFIADGGYARYWKHVVLQLAAPPVCSRGSCHGEPPRVFLTLKLERNSSTVHAKLNEMLDLLQPASVSISVERDADMLLYADLHATRAAARQRGVTSLGGASMVNHPECFWKDIAPHYVLTQAAVWWSTMASAWRSVVAWEDRAGLRFDAILFSRPDIFFFASMGPACAYDLGTTWYAPPGNNTPDMLWLFPRHIARRVLNTYEDVVVPCANHATSMCCNLSMSRRDGPSTASDVSRQGRPSPRDADRVTYSNWLRIYHERANGLRPDYHALRGWGLVGANPLKRWRNCTLHLGCMPKHLFTGIRHR